jgi:hypothetical protein
MATTEATMADAPALRPDRRVNGSPPPTQSKRDKRRQMLADRLASLSDKFSKDKDQAFREQLHKIQIDTTLVMRVDPYVARPLDGFEQDQQRIQQYNGDLDGESGPQTLLERAGPRFSKWMEKVQDLVEQRDYALTKYKVCSYSLPLARFVLGNKYLTRRMTVRLREKDDRVPHDTFLQSRNRESGISSALTDTPGPLDQRYHEQEVTIEQGEGGSRNLGLFFGALAAPQPVQHHQPC